MKRYVLPMLLLCALAGKSQGKENSKTKQIEQLQQLKQNVSRKIDSLQGQLPALANSIENTRKKIDQLRKETESQDRPDNESKEQLARLQTELNNASSLADSLKKQFETRTAALDKAFNLQKDLEEKITALIKDANQ